MLKELAEEPYTIEGGGIRRPPKDGSFASLETDRLQVKKATEFLSPYDEHCAFADSITHIRAFRIEMDMNYGILEQLCQGRTVPDQEEGSLANVLQNEALKEADSFYRKEQSAAEGSAGSEPPTRREPGSLAGYLAFLNEHLALKVRLHAAL